MNMKKLIPVLIAALLAFQPVAALAQTDSRGFDIEPEFDPNQILTDNDVFSLDGMSFDQLVRFMRSKGPLAYQRMPDIDGVEKSAPEIIWRIANMFKINPKYLLALLQKEQSLVEDQSPTQRQLDWAMGYGVCDSCSKDDPAIQDFKGFANQVYYAARQMREKYYMCLLMDGETISGYAPGRTVTIDGVMVTPVNYATAALYTYTPHIHGNQNLWKIWRRWFSKNFPNGSVVKGVPSGTIYWIRYGMKRPFDSIAVASSLVDLTNMAEVSDSELSGYIDGETIKFPNYALLKDPSGKIWLLVGDNRRHIVNMDTFRKFGFNIDEVEEATDADLAAYAIGEKINVDSMYPQGRLVQVEGLRAVWYAENGIKHLLRHPAFLSLYFPGQLPKQITQETLDELETGDAYALHDGELVKSDESPAVFVMEDGLKRPIPSGDVFETLGWNWKSIKTVPQSLLDIFELGAPIILDAGEAQIALDT